MGYRPTVFLSILAIGVSFAAADPLDMVFTRIDTAAKMFKSVSATISDTHHTAIVDADDTQLGTFKLEKAKDGIRMRIQYEGAQTIAYDPHAGRVYNPKTKVVDQYDLSKQQQEEATQFLALGFGASSAELKSAYDISYVGEEKIGDQTTSHLKLVPKAADLRKSIKQADLWYGQNGIVVQQKFLQPSGDYKLVKYSSMQLGNVTDKDVELSLPRGVTVQKH
jgi:outer membrane lipoprotein-sorting protein